MKRKCCRMFPAGQPLPSLALLFFSATTRPSWLLVSPAPLYYFAATFVATHPLLHTSLTGASGYSKHAVHGGAVFMYSRTASPLVNDTDIDGDSGSSASVYTLQSILVPSEPHGYAYFGHTVHFRGPVGLVSAYDENGSGVVYLYDLQHHALSTDVTDFKQAAAYLCKGMLAAHAPTCYCYCLLYVY